MRIGERGDRQLGRIIDARTPGGRGLLGQPSGRVGQPEEGRMQRAVAAGHEPQTRTDAQLPGDLLHACSPVGERMPSAAGQSPDKILPALPPGEGGPDLPLERSAAERGVPAPAADGDHDVGIDERPGEIQGVAGFISQEIGRGGVVAWVERCYFADVGTGNGGSDRSQRFERIGQQGLHVPDLDAGPIQAGGDGRHHGFRLRYRAGHGDHGPVPRHHVGVEGRAVRRGAQRRRHEFLRRPTRMARRSLAQGDIGAEGWLDQERLVAAEGKFDRVHDGG